MHTYRSAARRAWTALLAAAAMVACATPGDGRGPGPHGHGAHAGPGMTAAAHDGGMPDCPMMGADKACASGAPEAQEEAMCAFQRSLRDAPSDEARQAIIERHMGGMSPAMRQRHLDMMAQRCGH